MKKFGQTGHPPKRTFEAGEKYFERWKMLRDRKSFTPNSQFIFPPTFYLKTQKKFSLAREWFWPFKSINAPPLVWIESVNMITHRYYCELILLCLCVFKIPNPTIYQVWKIKQRSVIIAYIHTRLSRWCQLPFRFPARAW